MRTPVRTLAIACIAVSLASTLAACGGGHKKSATSSPPASTATTPPPSSSSAVAAPNINPFTGGKPSNNSVVAVKIDDTESGRPQRGIDLADMVYVEQVEGGLTRLIGVYNSKLPIVEAVRSTRASDPELMAQFGPIDYVASGGGGNPLSVLDHSPLKSTINDRGGPGFTRDGDRPAPYNLEANLAVVAAALHGPKAKGIGLTFDSAPSAYAGSRVAAAVHTVVGATNVDFLWNSQLQRWVREIGGVVQHAADGAVIDTPNVIVQFCKVTVYPQDVDVEGNPSQYTHTVGTGKAVIFRNGHAIVGSWYRGSVTADTQYTAGGKRIPLAPGGVWVLLVDPDASLRTS